MRRALTEILSFRKTAALVLIFVFVLAADLVIPGRMFMPDEERFYSEARMMSESGEFVAFGSYRAWEMPLVAVIYAPLYKITGGGSLFIKSVRVAQAFVLILTALGAALTAFSIFRDKLTASIVLFSVTIYPSFLAYQCLLLSETLFTCFLVWGFAFLYLWEGRTATLAASVAAFMLSLYTRATVTVLMPLLVAARSMSAVGGWRDRIRSVIFSIVLFAVCMSPWWVRNWIIFGRFVPYSTSASWNLYLGNNPRNLNAGVDWGVNVDVKKTENIFALKDELLISEAFMKEGRAYIIREPAVFLRNAWMKFKRFWNIVLNANSEKLPKYFKYYNIASILSWGVAFPFALISVLLNRRKWLLLLPVFTLVVYYTFIHAVVISSLRYRLPIEPFFIILGADCMRRFYGRLREKCSKRLEARK